MIANLLNYLITLHHIWSSPLKENPIMEVYICNGNGRIGKQVEEHLEQVITLVPAFCSLCYHIYIRTDEYKKEVFSSGFLKDQHGSTLLRTLPPMRPSCSSLTRKPLPRLFTRLRWEKCWNKVTRLKIHISLSIVGWVFSALLKL